MIIVGLCAACGWPCSPPWLTYSQMHTPPCLSSPSLLPHTPPPPPPSLSLPTSPHVRHRGRLQVGLAVPGAHEGEVRGIVALCAVQEHQAAAAVPAHIRRTARAHEHHPRQPGLFMKGGRQWFAGRCCCCMKEVHVSAHFQCITHACKPARLPLFFIFRLPSFVSFVCCFFFRLWCWLARQGPARPRS